MEWKSKLEKKGQKRRTEKRQKRRIELKGRREEYQSIEGKINLRKLNRQKKKKSNGDEEQKIRSTEGETQLFLAQVCHKYLKRLTMTIYPIFDRAW